MSSQTPPPQLAAGHGFGKLILCGEHAVVYGEPALGVAVQLGIQVTLREQPGPTRIAGLDRPDPRLAAALGLVLPSAGLEVRIDSELPIGCGMGSSAALAVALVRAEAQRLHTPLTHDEVWERAFAVEQVFHGNPSGFDHALACRGGVLRFVRGEPPELTALPQPQWGLVVLDSQVAGNTQALVSHVAKQRPGVDSVLSEIGGLVDEAAAVLSDAVALGPVLSYNHTLLQQLGVSTPALDALVNLALTHGATGAKLSGAGGGGVVLAITHDPEHLLDAARNAGVRAFATQVAEAL